MIELLKIWLPRVLPRDTVINVIRTTAAGVGGLLVVWLVGLGVNVDSETTVGVLQALAVGAFQLLVLTLSRWLPWLDYLLIIPKRVTYQPVDRGGNPLPPTDG